MLSITPKPNGQTVVYSERFSVPAKLSVDLDGFAGWCVDAFAERTRREIADGRPWLILSKDGSLEAEGYVLQVSPDGVQVAAGEETGVIWALTSLYLLEDEDETVPLCRIQDRPKFRYRGQSLDCVRHFFPADTVKRLIEQFSLVKLNVLHWHLTDDQGWRIESKRYPLLHQTSGVYYTQAEIRDIVAYARTRGMQVIPEIDIPGHTTSILAAYPEYSCGGDPVPLGTAGGIYSKILCAGKESVFQFLETVFDEICPLFPARYVHIGGDEAPKTEWMKCPLCARRMEQECLSRAEDLQGYFTKRVCEILARQGKHPICWNDSLEAANLPENILVQYWTNQHAAPMKAYVERGGWFLYSRKFELYFDYSYSLIPLQRVYLAPPVTEDGNAAASAHMAGLEGCLWSERIADLPQLGQHLFPRVYAAAEAAWSMERDYEDFKRRLSRLLAILECSGIAYMPSEHWDPSGEEKYREAAQEFLRIMEEASPESKAQMKAFLAQHPEALSVMIRPFFTESEQPIMLALLKEHFS